jgi:hypothetical protein
MLIDDQQLLFHRLASLITVRDIQTPLGPEIACDMTVSEAYEFISVTASENGYNPDRLSLVTADGIPVGWCGVDIGLHGDGPSVKDEMYAFSPAQMISDNTPYLKAVEFFRDAQPHFFFVLTERSITGTLHYENLFDPAGRLCLFALTMELEAAALQLCRHFAKECIASLSDERRSKTVEVYEKRYASQITKQVNPGAGDLLGCTMFSDKGRMIAKCKLLIDQGRDKIESIFSRSERLRNSCAHPIDDDDSNTSNPNTILGRGKLGQFLDDFFSLLASIREQARREV